MAMFSSFEFGCLFIVLNLFVDVQTSSESMSVIYRDNSQEKFVKSLDDFYISYPRPKIYKDNRFYGVKWHDSFFKFPQEFYVKLIIFGKKQTLYLKQNVNLQPSEFNVEDKWTNKASVNNDHEKRRCYYTGTIIEQKNSRIAVSTCHGLKGLIRTTLGNYFIEPMKMLSPSTFPHLVYKPSTEFNSTHNGLHGQNGTSKTCSVQIDEDDEKDLEDLPKHNLDDNLNDSKKETRSRRKRRTNNVDLPMADIEVFVVVDKDTAAFHGNESLEEYVLTMMNVVNDMYKERSLGALVNIVVAKILVLHEDQKHLSISSHGDKTLRSFCEWQYSRVWFGGKYNNRILKYDVALLITRKNLCVDQNEACGTIGMAYIKGMCKPKRRCSVVEDIGLNTAFTIAHELGHSLGMTHDGEDNHCNMHSAGVPHMMSPRWPQSQSEALKWSKCSRQALQEFLSSHKSDCIKEAPSEDYKETYPMMEAAFPGLRYNADDQCRQQYGSLATHCTYFRTTGEPTNICKQLWCHTEGETECVTKLDPPAKGTPCGSKKWCMYGECISNNTIPDRVDGGWSPWSNWTQCSRTCGVGVSVIERTCNNPKPRNGGRYCIGEAKKYRTCNTEACPPDSEDFRDIQCSDFNNNTFSWIPVHSDRNPCVLYCRPAEKSVHFSVQFAPKVVDGTPCRQGSTSDICIDGKCQVFQAFIQYIELGIETTDAQLQLQLDSKFLEKLKRPTAQFVVESVQSTIGGYVTAVVIPPGARNVVIKEEKPCASFLALKSGHGSSYINGNWKIELPGEYNVDGTIVYYQRKGSQETFYMKGPTKEPIHIMVLFQDFNFGVKYRYTLPLKTNKSEAGYVETKDGSYGWMQGPWGSCSVVCGGGIKVRQQSRCIHVFGRNVSVVDSKFCSGAKRPPIEEKICNEHKCPVAWAVTTWTPCSRTCGIGRQSRRIRCLGQRKDGKWLKVPRRHCKREKPTTSKYCVIKACSLSWIVGPWSKCLGQCGRGGIKYRAVSCPLRNACKNVKQPTRMTLCFAPPCVYKWVPEEWSACSTTCDKGIQTRRIYCRESHSNKRFEGGLCNNAVKPTDKRECSIRLCNETSTTSSPKTSLASTTISIRTREKGRSKGGGKPGVLGAPKAVPILNAKNCKRDILATWACSIVADIDFCKNPKDKIKCCSTCRGRFLLD